jgi:NACHT domain
MIEAPLRTAEKQLQLLALHLLRGQSSLLIVSSPDRAAERALADELRFRTKGEVAISEATLAPAPVERLSLSHHLSALPPPSGKSALFVFGLDDLSPADRSTAINAMNWGRERLRWAGYSVVLWVRPGTPGVLGNRAPDFFSWRSDVFDFSFPNDAVEREQTLARLRLTAPSPVDELRRRYCDFVRQTHQWLDFRGLLQLRNVVRLPLDDVFVPLQATEPEVFSLPSPNLASWTWDAWEHRLSLIAGTGEGSVAGKEPSERTGTPGSLASHLGRRVALSEALGRHRCLVVLGDPGSGKSTWLRFLALTFAQGRESVREHLGIDEDRLPILVPLSAFAEWRREEPELSLQHFFPRWFAAQGLAGGGPLFNDALHGGSAILLLDGLDEMLSSADRTAVSCAVSQLAVDCPGCRVIITSRIAGYAPGSLLTEFTHLHIAPFDDDDIRRFTEQWSRAFEDVGATNPTPLSDEARRRAELRAESLFQAVTTNPSVRRLGTNPLLLTLLALIHHQGTRLPHRRVDLYRLCVEALAETWNLARSLTGRPIDLRLGERRLDEEFVVGILAPVAYWMHTERRGGVVELEDLEAQVAVQFVAREGAATDQAAVLAHDFVSLAREQMGLLVERAPETFSFLHLTIQEYLAARFLSERVDGFERLRPHLREARWQEVVLLTAGCLRGDYATAFVERILNADGEFACLAERALALGRWASGQKRRQKAPAERSMPSAREEIIQTLYSLMNFLLVARSVADEVPVDRALRGRVVSSLFDLWRCPPFDGMAKRIEEVVTYSRGGRLFQEFLPLLLGKLSDQTEEISVRKRPMVFLAYAGEDEGSRALFAILQDHNEVPLIRFTAAVLLLLNRRMRPLTTDTLQTIAEDRGEADQMRASAAVVLGIVSQESAEANQWLMRAVVDDSEDLPLRLGAAIGMALWLTEHTSSTGAVRDHLQSRLRDDKGGRGVRSAFEVAVKLLKAGTRQWADRTAPGPAVSLPLAFVNVLQGAVGILDQVRASERPESDQADLTVGETGELGEGSQPNKEPDDLLRIASNRNETLDERQRAIEVLGTIAEGGEKLVQRLLAIGVRARSLRPAVLNALWGILSRSDIDTVPSTQSHRLGRARQRSPSGRPGNNMRVSPKP